jgi:small subunit ribosomal protein S6
MRFYETIYIINPDLEEEACRDVLGKFNNIIEKNGGLVIKVDEWRHKTLAYTVKKFDRGYYVLLQYCGETGLTAEFERDLKLDDRVLKFQTVKLSDSADPASLKSKADESKVEVEKAPSITEETAPEDAEETEDKEEV